MAKPDSGRIVKDVMAEGSCAVVGVTAEQCQLLALQRARAAAIEQAAGVAVTSSTLVTNSILAADFIKTYARGLIVKEKVEWLPLGQYQKDKTTAPIPEYRVKIVVDVRLPEKKGPPLGLRAELNRAVFRDGEKARVDIRTQIKARVAIFNLTADDKVTMIFPNPMEKNNLIEGGRLFHFPGPQAKVDLVIQNLPGHKRDAEAFLILAVDPSREVDFLDLFPAGKAMTISEFFLKYSEIADLGEDLLLTYEVVAQKGN